MIRRKLGVLAGVGIAGFVLLGATAPVGDDEGSVEVPPQFAPFEGYIGAWKGTGIPTANRLKGWQEKHMWAWIFTKGKPTGISLEITGGKVVSKAKVAYDPTKKSFTLAGTDPAGQPVSYMGKFDDEGQTLILDRQAPPKEVGQERLTFQLTGGLISYTMRIERQEAGAPQFARFIECRVTREGESLAAGGAEANLPKCIITGGAATLTVSYEGKSFPVCCTGCQEQFKENPAKYAKKALLRMQQSGEKSVTPASSKAPAKDSADPVTAESKDEMPKAKVKSKGKAAPRAKAKVDAEDGEPKAKPKTAPAGSKAASLLSQAKGLEKSGKTQAALTYYKQLVKEYPDSKEAKTAKERIDALGK